MGIWCAHGEGRAHFPDPQVKQAVLEGGLAPIRSLPFCRLLVLLCDSQDAKILLSHDSKLLCINDCCPVVHHVLNNLAQHCQMQQTSIVVCLPESFIKPFIQALTCIWLMFRYQGPSQEVTEQYPFNPNGSPEGIAALCSPNGRHLAIMPHPERCFLMWQNPWFPGESGLTKDGPGPWLKLFQNAREWCESL